MASNARRPAWLIAIGFTGAFLLMMWFVHYVLVRTLLAGVLERLMRGD